MIDIETKKFGIYLLERWTLLCGSALVMGSYVMSIGSPKFIFLGSLLSLVTLRSYLLFTKGITESGDRISPVLLILAKLLALLLILVTIYNGDRTGPFLISLLVGLFCFIPGALIFALSQFPKNSQ